MGCADMKKRFQKYDFMKWKDLCDTILNLLYFYRIKLNHPDQTKTQPVAATVR